jgi:hypothetical protein
MNKSFYKFLAILLTLILFGSINETLRIISSNEKDIASQRIYLIIMALIISSLIIYLINVFWKKSQK